MGRKKKTETAKAEEIKTETEKEAEAETESPIVNEILWKAKKILVDQYKHPERRDFHWTLMQGWIVDGNGELTEAGKAMVAEVEEWEAKEGIVEILS